MPRKQSQVLSWEMASGVCFCEVLLLQKNKSAGTRVKHLQTTQIRALYLDSTCSRTAQIISDKIQSQREVPFIHFKVTSNPSEIRRKQIRGFEASIQDKRWSLTPPVRCFRLIQTNAQKDYLQIYSRAGVAAGGLCYNH